MFSKYLDTSNKYCECYLRAYWISEFNVVIIATDLNGNDDKKINHMTKEVVDFISHTYNISPNQLMLIEHYPSNEEQDYEYYIHVLLCDDREAR